MRVTIYTDASMIGSASAWAAIVRREGMPDLRRAAALVQRGLKSSTLAELRAITNAVHIAAYRGYLVTGDEVMIYSDNQVAVRAINGMVPPANKGKVARRPDRAALASAADKAAHIAKQTGVKLSAEWVRGHRPDQENPVHAPFNRWCDKNARMVCRLTIATDAKDEAAIKSLRRTMEINPEHYDPTAYKGNWL